MNTDDIKEAAFFTTIGLISYLLISFDAANLRFNSLLPNEHSAIALIIGGASLWGSVIFTYWALPFRSKTHDILSIVTLAVTGIPPAVFIARPTSAQSFSYANFFMFLVCFVLTSLIFCMAQRFQEISEKYIEISVREIGLESTQQTILKRLLIFASYTVFYLLVHHVLIVRS